MIGNFIDNHYLMDKITLRDKLMNQMGGGDGYGDSIFNKYIHLVIGIILIVLGIILIKSEEEWGEINGIIKNMKQNDENSYWLLVEYNVSDTQFIKKVIGYNNNYKINDNIKISYNKTNPNIIKLYKFNYKYIGMIVGLIGIFTIIGIIYQNQE
jgi:hypothetical protein